MTDNDLTPEELHNLAPGAVLPPVREENHRRLLDQINAHHNPGSARVVGEPAERDWDATVNPATVFRVGWTQGVVDAARMHGPANREELLLWIIRTEETEENPYDGVGDAVGLLDALQDLLADCDQVSDTPSDPNMVKIWAVRQVLEPYGGEPHRWPVPDEWATGERDDWMAPVVPANAVTGRWKYRGWFRWMARRRCPHSNLIGIYGDQINHCGGWRLACDDCGTYLNGPVTLADTRKAETA